MGNIDSSYYAGILLDYCKKMLICTRPFLFKYDGLRLTRRETQCLACLILGMTAKQTAKVLSISPRTAQDYISFIKSKFNSTNRYQIVTKALLNGFPIREFLKNCKHRDSTDLQ